MRRPVIAGNWKMHKTISEAEILTKELKDTLKSVKEVDIILCPPFTALKSVFQVIEDANLKLGAQNMSWEEEGAYTGEISPAMLKDAGCDYAIIGHSERRGYLGEDDELVNKKIKLALAWSLIPIVCVGETLEQREKGAAETVVENQVRKDFAGLEGKDLEGLIIAYEPIWAIGTGKTATSEDADRMHELIRKILEKDYSPEIAERVRIQYGGSVKPENIDDLMAKENIDGALVGGASLKSDSFTRIVKFQRR